MLAHAAGAAATGTPLAKGSAQSLAGAARLGRLGDFFERELQRMPPMDIADVAYDHFLANGQPGDRPGRRAGLRRVRLRIVDGSATTYFHLEFAGGPLTIVAADGQDVEPVEEGRFLIGVAETYDVLVRVPAAGAWELRATRPRRVGVRLGLDRRGRAAPGARGAAAGHLPGHGRAEPEADLRAHAGRGDGDAGRRRSRPAASTRPGMMGHGRSARHHAAGAGLDHGAGHEAAGRLFAEPAPRRRATPATGRAAASGSSPTSA